MADIIEFRPANGLTADGFTSAQSRKDWRVLERRLAIAELLKHGVKHPNEAQIADQLEQNRAEADAIAEMDKARRAAAISQLSAQNFFGPVRHKRFQHG